MRLLLLNPNMTEAVTERLATVARAIASPGTEILPVTAPRGFPYISSRAEAQVAGALVLEMLAERAGTFDAAIVAAFGDPGLFPARELFDGLFGPMRRLYKQVGQYSFFEHRELYQQLARKPYTWLVTLAEQFAVVAGPALGPSNAFQNPTCKTIKPTYAERNHKGHCHFPD